MTLAFKKIFLVYFAYTGSFSQAALMELGLSNNTFQEHKKKQNHKQTPAVVNKCNVPQYIFDENLKTKMEQINQEVDPKTFDQS